MQILFFFFFYFLDTKNKEKFLKNEFKNVIWGKNKKKVFEIKNLKIKC